MEILAELPKLELADRREIFDRICEIEERDLLIGGATDEEKALLDCEIEERDLLIGGATDEEKALLDCEMEEYRRNPEAGSSWSEVEARIRKPSRP
jgi:hypothetical protein